MSGGDLGSDQASVSRWYVVPLKAAGAADPRLNTFFVVHADPGFVHIAGRSGGKRRGIGEPVEEGARDFEDIVGGRQRRENGDGSEGLADGGEGV